MTAFLALLKYLQNLHTNQAQSINKLRKLIYRRHNIDMCEDYIF